MHISTIKFKFNRIFFIYYIIFYITTIYMNDHFISLSCLLKLLNVNELLNYVLLYKYRDI